MSLLRNYDKTHAFRMRFQTLGPGPLNLLPIVVRPAKCIKA
jgi:hypothetical protein